MEKLKIMGVYDAKKMYLTFYRHFFHNEKLIGKCLFEPLCITWRVIAQICHYVKLSSKSDALPGGLRQMERLVRGKWWGHVRELEPDTLASLRSALQSESPVGDLARMCLSVFGCDLWCSWWPKKTSKMCEWYLCMDREKINKMGLCCGGSWINSWLEDQQNIQPGNSI